MLRLLIDENFDHRILRGVKLRLPQLDYLAVQDTELKGIKDPPLLAWAAENNRVLVTHVRIPGHLDHPFQSMLTTHSDRRCPLIPTR